MKTLPTELARFVRKDRGLNILKYNKKTQLINRLLNGQEMREGQPSFKRFCDLGLKLESCWVTHQQDDVDRFLHPWAISQLIKLTGTFTNPVTAFLIPFYLYDISVYDFILKTYMFTLK